jgi:hypothetical protein
MASVGKNFINFVAIGGQNPQILNIDFLKNNQIIPLEREPFATLLAQENPCKKFVSVPGFTNLVLGDIEFIVDEMRFQLQENKVSLWSQTTILEIAKRYYKVLPYTPLKLVGINLNSTIAFDSLEEAQNCQKLCLPEDSDIRKIVSADNISASLTLRYPYSTGQGRVTLTIEHPSKENDRRRINLNYEFDFVDWDNFRAELDGILEVQEYANSLFDRLLEAL